MPRICLVQAGDAGTAAVTGLERLLASQGLEIERLDETAVAQLPETAPEPDTVLLAPELARPLASARALRARWPVCELVFLQPEALVADFRRALGVAPMLGLHWSIEALESGGLLARIDQAAEAGARRRQFRATLSRANARLQQGRTQPEAQRQNLADHYLASFIDYSRDALVGLDLQGQVLFWSAGAVELTGVSANEAVGGRIGAQAFWSPELAAALDHLSAGGHSRLAETRVRVQGAERQVEVHCSGVRDAGGDLLGYSLLLRDVTALRQQQAASEASLQADYLRLHQLFHQAPGFVVVTRAPDQRIEIANRAFHQLVDREELVGLPAGAVFPELEGQDLEALLHRVHVSRRPFVGRGMKVRTRQRSGGRGRVRYLDFVFQPVLADDGSPTGIFCQGHDVTAEVQLREELKRSEEHLEALVEERTQELRRSQMALYQSQKLEAVGKLTGGVAHDFNNVLQIIGANLQLLRSGAGDDVRLLRRLESAAQAVERGARLSAQLLAFARRQPLSPTPTNLGAQLQNMDELLRRALGEHIRLDIRVPPGLWTTLVDADRLENVVLNLVINARDAMPDGGCLTLELANARLDEADVEALGDLAPGHYVMLSVADTGFGMSAELAEQVFEPFFTTKPEGKGTGLGLSMAYGFAKQSGGHIRLLSASGEGTRVTLYLPRTLLPEASQPVVEDVEYEAGNETILVVEDDPALQSAVLEQLAGLGYKVLRANDAQSALNILHSGVHVDLLFTDVVMPGPLRSTELAREARLLQPTIAVLFTSGYSQDQIIHDGRLDEGVELLSKPYRHEELARRLRQLLTARPDATERRDRS